MPLYEYQCKNCDKKVVLLQRSTQDDRELTCPACAGKDLARVFSTFSVGGAKDTPARQFQPEGDPAGQPGPPGPPGPEFHRLMVTNNPENLK